MIAIMQKAATAAILTFALVSFFLTSLRGIDFGKHWDERPWQIEPAQQMLQSGTFLPSYYLYPSLSLWVVLATTVPDFIQLRGANEMGLRHRVAQAMNSDAFLLRVRCVFVVFSTLTLLVLFLIAFELTGNPIASALGTWIPAASFEWSYHSRWIATDTLLCFFGCLSLYFSLRIRDHIRYAKLAAIAVGLATGSKYPGALCLFFPCFTLLGLPGLSWSKKSQNILWTGFWAAAAYLVTTPGTVLQPIRFLEWLRIIQNHYRSGFHWGSTHAPGLSFTQDILKYMAEAFFSSIPSISVFLFTLTTIGWFWGLKQKKVKTLLCLLFVLLGIVFFSRQSVFIVRNFLLLALVYSVGFSLFLEKNVKLPTAVSLVLVALNLFNLAKDANYVFVARTQKQWPDQRTLETLKELSKTNVLVVSKRLMSQIPSAKPHLHTRPKLYALLRSEIPRQDYWPANKDRVVTFYLAPPVVNFKYYPTFPAVDPVLVLNQEQLDALESDFNLSGQFRQSSSHEIQSVM